jgi:hypothetical protein
MEYSLSYLLWNENTCKTHKKQVFENKYSNPKSENFYFLLLKMISELLHSLTVVEKNTYFICHSFPIRPEPQSDPGSNATVKKSKSKKGRREMSAFEEEMLQLHKAHLEARINKEKRINKNKIRIVETKHQVELEKLEISKKNSV